MTPTALALVLASTITHAWWNFLLKRAGGSQIFVGLSKTSEVVLLSPIIVWMMLAHPAPLHGVWTLVVVGAVLVLLNYAALAKAYSRGHLSIVYPVSRGGVLFVLPVLGYLVFGERPGVAGASGMLLIVCGILVLTLRDFQWKALQAFGSRLATPATGFALAAAGFAALYTIWDKRAVNTMPVFHYFFFYTCIVAVVYMVALRIRYTSVQIAAEWRANHRSIISVGALNSTTYLMVLVALRSSSSSAVIAVRQLSIAWSVALGVAVLREPLRAPTLVGSLMILVGCGLTALQ
ncbi:MAG: EamA family transporter [Gemmatimonadaceae bacterium]